MSSAERPREIYRPGSPEGLRYDCRDSSRSIMMQRYDCSADGSTNAQS